MISPNRLIGHFLRVMLSRHISLAELRIALIWSEIWALGTQWCFPISSAAGLLMPGDSRAQSRRVKYVKGQALQLTEPIISTPSQQKRPWLYASPF